MAKEKKAKEIMAKKNEAKENLAKEKRPENLEFPCDTHKQLPRFLLTVTSCRTDLNFQIWSKLVKLLKLVKFFDYIDFINFLTCRLSSFLNLLTCSTFFLIKKYEEQV